MSSDTPELLLNNFTTGAVLDGGRVLSLVHLEVDPRER